MLAEVTGARNRMCTEQAPGKSRLNQQSARKEERREEHMTRGPKLVGAPGKAFPRKPREVDTRPRRRCRVKESELGEGT